MATLLHLLAHPHPADSHSCRLAAAFLERYRATHPDDTVVELDLYQADIPHLSAAHLAAMFWPGDRAQLPEAERRAWAEILQRVEQFTAAQHYLVTTPMWNFGVPSILKAYIDHIVLAGYTFQFTGPGASVGLLTGRNVAIICARGGIFSQPPFSSYEMCVTYLREIFGFLGIHTIAEIVAEGLALVGVDDQEAIMQPALANACAAAEQM